MPQREIAVEVRKDAVLVGLHRGGVAAALGRDRVARGLAAEQRPHDPL